MTVAAVAAGGVVARRVASGRPVSAWPRNGSQRDTGPRWHVVTVNRRPDEVSPDDLPEPLARLRDRAEVQVRPAPGDKGTELAVRPRDDDGELRKQIRLALRESKSLLETGEVLLPSYPPTTEPTLMNKPLREATARAREEGRL